MEKPIQSVDPRLKYWNAAWSRPSTNCGTASSIRPKPLRRRWRRLGAGSAAGPSGGPMSGMPFANEQQLAQIRDQCRALAVTNEFAINGHENRISYIVGSGHVYRAVARNEARAPTTAGPRGASGARRVRPPEPLAPAAAGDRPPQGPRRRMFYAPLPGRDGTMRVRFVEPAQVAAPDGTLWRPRGQLRHPDRPGRRGDRAGLLDRRPTG